MSKRIKSMMAITTVAAMLLLAGVILSSPKPGSAQTAGAAGGTISGTVTANRDYALSESSGQHIPAMVAVRVGARDEVRRITYTVFTQKGHYNIYNLPPGNYKITALQDGFTSTTPTVDLKVGETKTANVALTAEEDHLRAELVDFDTLFPPSPTRDLVMENCMGCHGFEHIPWQRMGGRDEETWRAAEAKMFTVEGTNGSPKVAQVNPAGVSPEIREKIIKYWSTTFPAGRKQRDLKLGDMPLDEAALSKTIYIEYDLPPVPPGKTGLPTSHDVWPSKFSSTIYIAEMGSDVVSGMDTTRLDYPGRFKVFSMPNPNAGIRGLSPHGITEAKDGHVYTAEIGGSMIGEIDPETGKISQYPTPTLSTPHTIRSDTKGNLWFTEMQGASRVDKLDGATKKISVFDPAPAYKNAHYYGMTVDQKDRVWAVGMTAHIIVGYDQKTEKWSVYPTPTQPSGPRRPTVDPNGMVWFSEHIGQGIGMLNPETGKITEYKNPLPYAGEYECYADRSGTIWVTLRSYGALGRFDQTTKKWSYYPLPFADRMGREHPGAGGTGLGGVYPPKIEQDAKNGTIWYGGLGLHVVTNFKPEGNVPSNNQRAGM